MAIKRGTVIYRPSADITLGHSCSAGTTGFNLINEETADDDSTYIYTSNPNTALLEKTSEFAMSPVTPIPDGAKIVNFKKCHVGKKSNNTGTGNSAGISTTYYYNDTAIGGIFYDTNNPNAPDDTIDVSYKSILYDSSNADGWLNSSPVGYLLKDANIKVEVRTTSNKGSGKNSPTLDVRLTQLWCEFEYEYDDSVSPPTNPVIYFKESGNWVGGKEVYKKTGGVWTKQTGDLESLLNGDRKYIRGS